MASQKQDRAGSGQARGAGDQARTGSGQARGAGQKQARAGSGQARGAGQKQARAGSGQARGAGDQAGNSGNKARAAAAVGAAGTGRPGQSGRKVPPPGQSRPPAGKARPGRPGPAVQEHQPAKAADTQLRAPRWLQFTTLILSVFGLGVSVYLTIAHYTSPAVLACSDKGLVNCAKVTTSPESVVFGIFPVSVLGLAFYVFMVAINTPWAWRSKWAWRSRLPAAYWARLGSVVVGMIFVLYLLYAEIVEIGNICLWCTSVHVVTFVLFVLLVFHASSRPRPASPILR
jgi:uncharacterized membrane protein